VQSSQDGKWIQPQTQRTTITK
jgi:predicted secreted protein